MVCWFVERGSGAHAGLFNAASYRMRMRDVSLSGRLVERSLDEASV